MAEADAAAREAILTLVRQRGAGKSICPSEAAKRLDGEDWRGELKRVRAAARAMAEDGEIVILRKGKPIPPERMKGVIRLALPDES